MKKLLCLFGALGLLAFVAMPIYAQEEDVALDDEERIATEAEDVDAVADEFNEEVEAIADDAVAEIEATEEAVEDTAEDVAEEATEGLLVALVFGILAIIALWKAFTRAWEGGWKAIIPVYNTYIQFKLADMKNWFWYMILIAFIFGVVAACLPDYKDLITNIWYVVSWIIGIVASFKFARKYGWWVFASILFVLFYPICILVLGFGNYPYEWKKSEETVVEA